MREWISVHHHLPPIGLRVLVYVPDNNIANIKIDIDCITGYTKEPWERYVAKFITHWMPLPEPPKGAAE